MKRGSKLEFAARSAFGRSIDRPADATPATPITTGIRTAGQAFVAGFPALVGLPMVYFAFERGQPDSPATLIGGALVLGSFAFLILGLRSFLTLDADRVTVCFYGLRSTTVRLDEIEAATFAMLFPSISWVTTITDRHGRRARIHANWWRDEAAVMPPIFRSLVERDVAMDRATARLVSQVLRIKRPKARIVHHALLRKDRTW